ncbi:bifunctional N-acetylglucosamine-1-phosphate uridyltransferase/glucosamine-1-phosphate acetyltransferase [Pleomorphomonas diazotrophica]|uniref:Bifunctional protein GlmU n=1 Tax=Pleomorphomonas diazotrophica TaxID=1166257 RepID=A0A1I4WP06_9HYPH|nr:bifunctional UDP-N-acetylglucosamine diphosphorylase/glucosamine-1-phosphate N-acetyltransferase GlmU [Pleomorphomonas diazotrophica]PKR87181.1 bifunctional N-acetylglucosamine-1-phosphate uridyltransferase/glucosamine-1-phosphate acetyltransferase [Pleomorphomonas diazotrophica]SFN14870.1 bifunctional UDP-N-acetylglucosamine pyrophosphorylase / Glucosamine-1-phosphate N-acetyltransferase [Pleomorphomonas diazotrophica]
MIDPSCLAVVLAAGEGTRMKSDLPKVLHAVGGRPLIDAVLESARAGGASRVAVVIGAGADRVRAHLGKVAPDAQVFEQRERLGTAHAALAAREALATHHGPVLVLFGDTPLVRPATIASLVDRLSAGADIALLGFTTDAPTGYGRLIIQEGRLLAIVEEKDADTATKSIRLCNSGIMAFRPGLLPDLLDAIGNENAKGEYYLTDAVAVGTARGLRAEAVIGKDEDEFVGINDRAQLAAAEAIFQQRMRAEAMAAGVTLVAPETVFFSFDTKLGRDVVVEPNVVFAPGVTVASGATIRAFSHIEGARVGGGAIVGPYSRLRPGADLAENVHVGNFVEIKNARVDQGAKVNHLTYIGDASIGARTNVGAGTITCNYDGFFKHKTVIGADVFVGSNTVMVAPVTVGDNALTAAGSVITADVPGDAMAFGRARQEVKEGMGAAKKAALAARKAASKSGG